MSESTSLAATYRVLASSELPHDTSVAMHVISIAANKKDFLISLAMAYYLDD
jgi:hypothetical protein